MPGLESAAESSCLSESEMSAFVEGVPANGRSRGELSAHIAHCSECREVVSALVQSTSIVRAKDEVALAATEYPQGSTRENASAARLQGELVGGKYRIGRTLGVGGMGIVLEGLHEGLGQTFAVKFLHGTATESEEARERFLREARSAAQLRGEHIVRVTDTGTHLVDGVHAPFFVMELLHGQSMQAVLLQTKRLDVTTCATYMLEVCEALAEAHRAGMVHRDLKPDNLFLATRADGSASIKVVDFGISKQEDLSLTSQNMVMGTPRYMAPEQMRSAKSVDARADLWALGVIMYEALSGKPPFDAPTMTELITKVQLEPHEPLHRAAPDLPKALSAAIERCLMKEVGERTPNVQELARALVPFAPMGSNIHLERIERMAAVPTAAREHATKGVQNRAPWFVLAGVLASCAAAYFVYTTRTVPPTDVPVITSAALAPPPQAIIPIATQPTLPKAPATSAKVPLPTGRITQPRPTASTQPAVSASSAPADPHGLRSRN